MEKSSDEGFSESDLDNLEGLERMREFKASLHENVEKLVNLKHSILGVHPSEVGNDILNYCYEVDDEIDVGNAHD